MSDLRVWLVLERPQLTNCLNCGKIICKLEAGKTCTFCTLPLENVGPMSKKAIAINRDEALKADDA